MREQSKQRPLEILLVEDNLGDIRLAEEVLKEWDVPNRVRVARDGEAAMARLRGEGAYSGTPRPDLMLLDLNMPKKDGREVLAEVKSDPGLRSIPIIVLSTSSADQDINMSYDLHANCYLTKPVELDEFIIVVNSIKRFWLQVVRLPNHGG